MSNNQADASEAPPTIIRTGFACVSQHAFTGQAHYLTEEEGEPTFTPEIQNALLFSRPIDVVRAQRLLFGPFINSQPLGVKWAEGAMVPDGNKPTLVE